ncbi:MAG: hypothetical protein J5I90_06490 [Caldilineales bacterium]|nr:hypothetical protein [Caldilineales bacterium]
MAIRPERVNWLQCPHCKTAVGRIEPPLLYLSLFAAVDSRLRLRLMCGRCQGFFTYRGSPDAMASPPPADDKTPIRTL